MVWLLKYEAAKYHDDGVTCHPKCEWSDGNRCTLWHVTRKKHGDRWGIIPACKEAAARANDSRSYQREVKT